MRLILVRHGETKDNKEGIIQGQTNCELNDEGISQAKRVAKRLKDEKVDVIYSSDLKRAHDTARFIADYNEDVHFISVKELRERCHGEAEGKKCNEIDWTVEIKGRESTEELEERVREFLHRVLEKHKDEKVMFVCHGGIGKAIISVITSISFDEIEHLKNTSVSLFEIFEDGSHKIHLINCAKHLE